MAGRQGLQFGGEPGRNGCAGHATEEGRKQTVPREGARGPNPGQRGSPRPALEAGPWSSSHRTLQSGVEGKGDKPE